MESTSVENSEAICLAQASDWKSLQRLLERDPTMAKQRGDHDMLPIHWACTVRRVPLSLIVKLLQAYPDGVRAKNSGQLLPLHIAIRAGVQSSCLRKLVRAYPEAVTERTPDGVSALEMAQDLGLDTESLKVLYRAYERASASQERRTDGTRSHEKDSAGLYRKQGLSGQEEGEASGVERPGDDEEDKEGKDWTKEAVPEPYVGNGGSGGLFPASDEGELDAIEWSTLEPEDSISMMSEQSLSDIDGLDMPHGHLVSPSSTSTCSQDDPRSPFSSESSFTAAQFRTGTCDGVLSRGYSNQTYGKAPTRMQSTSSRPLQMKQTHSSTDREPRNLVTPMRAGNANENGPSSSHRRPMSQRSHDNLHSFQFYDEEDDDDFSGLENRSRRDSSSPRGGGKSAIRAHTNPREGLFHSAREAPRRSVTLNGLQRGSPPLFQKLHRRASHEFHGPSHHEPPPEWKHDGECSICRATFGMFKHRHHCRNCGKSICSQHSADKKISMQDKGFTTPQRVCVTCYAMITHCRSLQQGNEREGKGHDNSSAFSQPPNALTEGTTAALAYVPSALPNRSVGSRSESDLSLSVSPTTGQKRRSRNSSMLAAGEATGGGGERVTASNRGSGSSASTSLAIQELRNLLASQQKQIEQLAQSNMQMQQQLLEQEEVKAETMLLITQLMTRISVLELHQDHSSRHCSKRRSADTGESDDEEYPQDDSLSFER